MHRHDAEFEIIRAEIVERMSRAEDMRIMSIVLCARFFPRSHSCMTCFFFWPRRRHVTSEVYFFSAGREAHDHRAFFIEYEEKKPEGQT